MIAAPSFIAIGRSIKMGLAIIALIKSASFKAWDLESKHAVGAVLSVDELKNIDWVNSRMALTVQLSGVYFQASGYGAVLNIKFRTTGCVD